MKYKHALCLYPYFKETSGALGFFPPVGLEYIEAALEGYTDRITLIDLRHEQEYQNIDDLRSFIKKNVDLLCVSVNWGYYFNDVCNLINCLIILNWLLAGNTQQTILKAFFRNAQILI